MRHGYRIINVSVMGYELTGIDPAGWHERGRTVNATRMVNRPSLAV